MLKVDGKLVDLVCSTVLAKLVRNPKVSEFGECPRSGRETLCLEFSTEFEKRLGDEADGS